MGMEEEEEAMEVGMEVGTEVEGTELKTGSTTRNLLTTDLPLKNCSTTKVGRLDSEVVADLSPLQKRAELSTVVVEPAEVQASTPENPLSTTC